MKTIERQAHVMHSVEQMFTLVNDINSYPQFLPGCTGACIQQQGDGWLQARLELSRGGIHQYFVTRNRFTAHHRIDMELVEGPMSSLAGYWLFTPVRENACRINLHLTFSISNFFLRMTTKSLFEQLAGTMVEAFCRRADVVYGTED